MRPWIYESELASYLEAQRSCVRSETSASPTFTPARSPRLEDLAGLDRSIVALQDLQTRLVDNEGFSRRLSQLLEFLQQLRCDIPIPEAERAFERLQRLRSWLFWLPPAMLRAGDSDLGAMAVLSQFFAAALTLEPLFPEIGGAYLGSMSIGPIEEVQRILLARRTSHPEDAGVQLALSLVETPIHVLSEYKTRQQHLAHKMDSFRASPHIGPFAIPKLHLASSPELPPRRIYSNSPMLSPANLGMPNSPYHTPGNSSVSSGRGIHYFDSVHAARTPMMGGRSMSYVGMIDGSPGPHPSRLGAQTEMELRMGYQETTAFPSYGGTTGFVSPQQLWA